MRARVICRVEKSFFFFTLSTTALFLYQKRHSNTSDELVRYSVTPRARFFYNFFFYYFVACMYAILLLFLLLLLDWGFVIKVVHGPIGMHMRAIQERAP